MANPFKQTKPSAYAAAAAPATASVVAPKASAEETRRKIAEVAFRLYEERGRANGHDLEDWLAAEQIVSGRSQKAGTARA